MIQIIPAIDIIGGKCVRLSQGDYSRSTTYHESPVEMAHAFVNAGFTRIHVVDLDGAKASHPVNLHTLRRIASIEGIEVEWGGGLKSTPDIEAAFAAGATYAVVGSVAATNPSLFAEWLNRFSPRNMVLGADVRGDRVAVSGWTVDTDITIDSLIDRFTAEGLSQAIVTDIARDGMLQGPSDRLYVDLQTRYPAIDFTVSGGISSVDDITRLDSLGLRRVIVGKALYEGHITLADLSKLITI